jgi:hypothetical protein
MAWNAGPGVLHAGRQNSDRVGGRAGVGGGPAWRKIGKVDSKMVGDRVYEQEDYGDRLAYEEQQAAAGLWQGRGVGRGPLWPEGGGKGEFMKNAGWREGEKESLLAPKAHMQDDDDGAAACKAVLQVFKFGEGDAKSVGRDISVRHRSAVGRDSGAQEHFGSLPRHRYALVQNSIL